MAQFSIKVDPSTGAINEISDPNDPYKMNWIFSSADGMVKWQKKSQDWGMGKYSVAGTGIKDEAWIKPARSANPLSFVYRTSFLNVKVDREMIGTDLLERFSFTNNSGKKIRISSLSLYTPFNDNYPNAAICATNRCNAHIWAGLNSSYVNAIRMNGQGQNMGLVLTKGSLVSYSIENRDIKTSGSNARGTILLNVEPFNLEPGKTYQVEWKLFWHKGWVDFYKKAVDNGLVKVEADSYIIERGKQLNITLTSSGSHNLKTQKVTVPTFKNGEHTWTFSYDQGRKKTLLNYLVLSTPSHRIDQRARFIVNHQQMNIADDPRYGAYMVYDNELHQIFDKPQGTVSDADRDEGRERLGMGVFLAKWLQRHNDEEKKASLMRYVKFVREKLQTPDYKIYSNVEHTSGERTYNYPWVAHLYLETYKLTKDRKYLEDFYGTVCKYYNKSGYGHYAIGLRIEDGLLALAECNMTAERDSLLFHYSKAADFFLKTGLNYPKHEVNYEQSIVAPAVEFLCEMFLVTKDKKYLDGAKLQMPALEAFNGRQPDVHLNEIAIRHWDGYWFGKTPTWGDVMPHYWSTLTALAFHKYYQCTGNLSYQQRAKKIVDNNLLNFEEDGMAHCAYLYPAMINGKSGKFYDQFANDQDWALVYYDEVMYH